MKMKISLKPHHLKRYKDIALLFLKYSSADFAKELDLDQVVRDENPVPARTGAAQPEELADDLERMGPTFVKLGQLLSSRADLLPEPYLKALARLQDRVKPFPFPEVERIVEQELGARISKAFASFDEQQIAAASLGQVHRACMRDGRAVVVKVQRPDIHRVIAEDFEVLAEIAAFCDLHTEVGRRYRFGKILAEFKNALEHELDYRREAGNLVEMEKSLKQFPRIHVPQPVPDYSTSRVLTMQYISGTKITSLSPLAHLDMDGESLADELFQAYLKQVLVDGFFHADPHPGNVFLTDDKHIALLDLGMVGRINEGLQENLLRLLAAISEGNGDQAVEIVLKISETREDFDETEFRRRASQLVSEQRGRTLGQQDIGRALLEVSRSAAETGVYAPSELTLLGKTLLQLDQIGRILSPNFDPNASLRRNLGKVMTQRMFRSASPGQWFASVLELKDFISRLPNRLNKLLDAAAGAELELKVRTPDAHQLLTGFEKIANRITTGVILASLIIGASLLMQINTPFQILGYPGLAILCFLAAGGGGVWLVLSILVKDYHDKHRRRD